MSSNKLVNWSASAKRKQNRSSNVRHDVDLISQVLDLLPSKRARLLRNWDLDGNTVIKGTDWMNGCKEEGGDEATKKHMSMWKIKTT